MLLAQIVCLTCQGNASAYNPSMSSDGRFVAFQSGATNLIPGDTNGFEDIFVADTETGAIQCITLGGNGYSGNATISGNGRYVMFASYAAFDRGDTNGQADACLWDRETGHALRLTDVGWPGGISATGRYRGFEDWRAGTGTGVVLDTRDGSSFPIGYPGLVVSGMRISANGRFTCFGALDYTTKETQFYSFIYDSQTGVTEQVDDGSGQGTCGGQASDDGDLVLFYQRSGLILYNRLLGTTQTIGQFPTGLPCMTPSGRFIAWAECETTTNGYVTILDRATGTQTQATPLGLYCDPVLSADASRLAFVGFGENDRANVYFKVMSKLALR